MSEFASDFSGATVRPSPNFGQRAGQQSPSMLILHYTGMKSGALAEDWLCNADSQVSSHYLVHEDGRVIQMVREADRAWHAGKSFWRGVTDINSASVGIEIVNPGHEFGYVDFPAIQMDSVVALCRDIVARHAIAAEMVLAHSDVAPGRKVDPGERFDWMRLAREGIGRAVVPAPIRPGLTLTVGAEGEAVRLLQSALSTYGYDIDVDGVFDLRTKAVVTAFQQHFRQERVDGAADLSTLETLKSLLAAGLEIPSA